jgi:hypothetical protein
MTISSGVVQAQREMRRGRCTDRPLRAQGSVRASARLVTSEQASADRHYEALEPGRSGGGSVRPPVAIIELSKLLELHR